MTKRFECVQCGGCCRQSGDLRLLPEDVEKLFGFFGIDFDELCRRYEVTNIERKLYFINIHNGCPFLDAGNKCILQEAKPFFCANYIPFVDGDNSPIYSVCQGIGQGREWTDEEIKKRYDEMLARLVIVRVGGDV